MTRVTTHSFDVSIAKKHGIDAALIIGHFAHFIEHHRANKTNFFEGHYWTYDTAASLAEKFPYWTKNKIQKLLVKMEDNGLIESGDFSEDRFQRPKYYRITLRETAGPRKPNGLLGESQMADCTGSQMADSSLSDQSTIQSTDHTPISPRGEKPEVQILEYLNAKRKESFDSLGVKSQIIKSVESNLKPIRARLKNYSVDEIKTVIDHLVMSWSRDSKMRQYLVPSSIFRSTKFDGKHVAAQEWKMNGASMISHGVGNRQEALEARNRTAGEEFLKQLHGGSTYEHE